MPYVSSQLQQYVTYNTVIHYLSIAVPHAAHGLHRFLRPTKLAKPAQISDCVYRKNMTWQASDVIADLISHCHGDDSYEQHVFCVTYKAQGPSQLLRLLSLKF